MKASPQADRSTSSSGEHRAAGQQATVRAATAETNPDTRGIVLAGAYPRGRSLFDALTPRPLLPVAQAPLIAYPLRWLCEGGIGSVTVCTNSAARAVQATLTDARACPMEIDFREDWMPRGAAGCVRDAALQTDARTFVVVDGTTIPRVDLQGLLETHLAGGAALTVVAHQHPEHAAGASALTPGGIYVFDRRALDYVPAKGFQDIKERLIPRLHAARERVVIHTGYGCCPRVFDTETYLAVNQWMTTRVIAEQKAPEEYELLDEALVHRSVRLGSGVRLIGPLVLGPGVTVGAGATLVGPATVGPECVVGENSLVSRSVLWSRCRVGRDSSLDRCVVADRAVIRRGVRLYRTLKGGPVDPGSGPHKRAKGAAVRPGWGDALVPIPASSWRTGWA
jgi:NDP-sugar pyrophosphorylase family protein